MWRTVCDISGTCGSTVLKKHIQMAAFAQLGLDEWLVQQCQSVGLKKPTPVQEKCVQPILEGDSLSLPIVIIIINIILAHFPP